MGERSEERKEQYKRIRSEFEDLQIEDKALFILEATVATVGRSIEQFGKGFADEIEKAFRTAERRQEEAATEEAADEPNSAPASSPSPDTATGTKPKPPKGSGSETDPIV